MKERRKLTAADYQEKLAKAERDEERVMTRLARTLGRLQKLRAQSKYLRKRIEELSD